MRTLPLFALGFGACFGEGPIPSNPTEATVLYTAPSPSFECNGAYVGSVAIGPGTDAYVVAQPFTTNQCGTSPPPVPLSVEVFQKAAKLDPVILGDAGKADASFATTLHAPRVSAVGIWAYEATGSDGLDLGIMVDPSLGLVQASTQRTFPAGIITDATSVFVAGWQAGGGRYGVDHPDYPCCGPVGPQNPDGGANTLTTIPIGGGSPTPLPVAPTYACESMSECLAANTSSLFYMEHAEPGHVAKITRFPKTGTAAAEQAMIGTVDAIGVNKVAPVGLVASDSHVVWSVSTEYELQRSDDPVPPSLCIITAYDLTTEVTTVLLSTTEFSCMHASLDTGFVYFAIVSIVGGHLHGDGIGRVAIAEQTFESLALGIEGDSAGPRRVYVVDDSMYLVDPFTVVAVKKSALDGKQDFAR